MMRRNSLVIALMLTTATLLFAGSVSAQGWISYSPLTAVGVGPSGPATAKIHVEPFCCPSTALLVRARTAVGEEDFQWVNLGLTVPQEADLGAVKVVEVCYSLKVAKPGGTYISQTRLTDMTTPDAAHVVLDDPTDRKDPGPTCYRVEAGVTPKGTLTLALKVVFASTDDEIRVGLVRLHFGAGATRTMMMEKKKLEKGGKGG